MSTREPRGKLRQKYMLLCNQDFKCIYCGEIISEKEAEIEHFHPYVYVKHKTIFYDSCKECNQIKGTQIFDNLGEAREYIKTRRESVSRMPKVIHTKKEASEVLHEQVPLGKLEEIKYETGIACENCGTISQSRRKTKRFCNGKCRVAFWSKNHPRIKIDELNDLNKLKIDELNKLKGDPKI